MISPRSHIALGYMRHMGLKSWLWNVKNQGRKGDDASTLIPIAGRVLDIHIFSLVKRSIPCEHTMHCANACFEDTLFVHELSQ